MSWFAYTIFYILFAGGIIYPPTEFVSAGITISEIFGSYFGNELHSFIQHHIRRTAVTLFVHSSLPFIYTIGLIFLGHLDKGAFFVETEHPVGLTLLICTFTGPLYALFKIFYWSRKNWSNHPIAKSLSVYCDNRGTWSDVARDIDNEYRRIDKLQIATNTRSKIVVTNTWIMKVSPYNVDIAIQLNSTLVMCNVNVYSPNSTGDIVYAKFQIVTRQPGGHNFTIRINARDIQNLLDKITMPRRTLPSAQLPPTKFDMCIAAIKEEVAKNSRYKSTEKLEQCVVCMQATANVKMVRQCPNIPAIDSIPACGSCNCPPIYCIDCMAKWFMTGYMLEKQLEEITSLKSSCPQCRAVFCILDVQYVDGEAKVVEEINHIEGEDES